MAKRNKALDNWLESSKAVNQELAEDPEAREAAAAQAAAAGEDSPHVDPTDNEAAASGDDDDGGDPEAKPEAAAEPDDAARAAAEAAAAAEKEAKGDTAAQPDERDRQLKNSQEEAKRLKREKEEAKRQLADARRQLAEAQNRPAPAAPAAPAAAAESEKQLYDVPAAKDDPMPDRASQPIEYTDWLSREGIRIGQAAEARAAAAEARVATFETGNHQQRMENDFVALMDQEKLNFKVDHPDFDARLDHIKTSLRRQMVINGVPAHQIEASLRDQERRFLVGQTALAQQAGEPYPGQYALDRLAELAETYGYHEAEGNGVAAAAPAAAAPKNGTKPAPTAAAQVEDRAKRAAAARTATTMSGTAPETHDPNAAMTAERFLKMSWAQREAYKKQHPNTMDRIFGEGEEQDGVHPLLAGR